MASLRSKIPWHTRIAAKLVLSRVPAGYAFWHRLDLFSHGSMDRPDYAHDVFATHFRRTPFGRKERGYVALEIGPGDSAMSALVARAYGATTCFLVDAGRFAATELAPYQRLAAQLKQRGMPVPDISDANTLDEVLSACGARYMTEGLESLRELPSSSIDFVWSQAVLEHVRRADFLPTMNELRRVLRPDGACSHRVDLMDHLGGGLNNMRIPSRWWEKDWMAKSGFYTNRLRFSEMLQLFRDAGFAPDVVAVSRWDAPPLSRAALASEFRHLDDDDLLVKGFDVVLRPV